MELKFASNNASVALRQHPQALTCHAALRLTSIVALRLQGPLEGRNRGPQFRNHVHLGVPGIWNRGAPSHQPPFPDT